MEQKTSDLLKKYFALKKSRFESYSIRNLAQNLGVSPSLASRWLSGQRRIGVEKLMPIIHELDIDQLGREQVLKSYGVIDELRYQFSTDQRQSVEEMPDSKRALFSCWKHFALLNLIECKNFRDDPRWIADRLQISLSDALSSWELLLAHDCVEKKEGRWHKKDKLQRYLTAKPGPMRIRYYSALFKKAGQIMTDQTTPADFQRRLINGAVVTSNPESIAKARAFLEKALLEAAHILSEGESTEVYSLGIQLLPLTKTDPA